MSKLFNSSLRMSALVLIISAAACSVAQTSDKTIAHDQVKVTGASHSSLPALSASQMTIANRVLTGKISCELDQSVEITPLAGQEGYFKVAFNGNAYQMAPEPTTTGAVRLEDKKAGAMWLQIGTKSMLMNAKIGQRMVDNCVHPSQKI